MSKGGRGQQNKIRHYPSLNPDVIRQPSAASAQGAHYIKRQVLGWFPFIRWVASLFFTVYSCKMLILEKKVPYFDFCTQVRRKK